MDIFSNAPAPTASTNAYMSDGFHLDNGVKIGDGSGLLLVSGETCTWRSWEAGGRGRLLNQEAMIVDSSTPFGPRTFNISQSTGNEEEVLVQPSHYCRVYKGEYS